MNLQTGKALSSLLTIIVLAAVSTLITPTATSQNPTTSAYNVRTFGAKGDGKTLDTLAINKTIDAAAAAGGGTVYFPAGNYLSVSIHLKSNIALYLDQG